MACHAAQDQLAQWAVRIGAHHQQVGGEIMCLVQERLSERTRTQRQDVQADREPVFQEDRGNGGAFRRVVRADQYMDLLRTGEPAQSRKDRSERRLLVSPGNGDGAAEGRARP